MTWQCELPFQKHKYILGCTKKDCGQQDEKGDSPPLLHSQETPPGVLHPPLGLPA